MASSSNMKQQYNPTSEELKDAIDALIKEPSVDPQDARVIQKALEENNPNWKLPQRRVLKYVKKAVRPQGTSPAGSETGSTLDDDESLASNTSSSVVGKRMVKGAGSSLRNVLKKKDSGSSRFSFRRKKENALPPPPVNISTKDIEKETAPTSPLSPGAILPSISQEEHDVDALIEKVQQKKAEEEFNPDDIIDQKATEKAVVSEQEEATSRAANAYEDDNDGKPESRNCAECAQCVIQ